MRNVLFLFLLYGTISVWAQMNTFLSVDIENDFINVRGKGTDRYYTGGHRLVFWKENSKKKFRSFGMSITQQTYTPSDLQEVNPALLDYPYAGLLFCSLHMLVLAPEKGVRVYNKFSIGTSGPRSGVATWQRTIHRMIGDEIPQGWFLQNSSSDFIQFETQLVYPLISINRWQLELLHNWEGGNYFDRFQSGFRIYYGELPPSVSLLSQKSSSRVGLFRNKSTCLSPSFLFAVQYSQVLRNRLLEESSFRETFPNGLPLNNHFLKHSLLQLTGGIGFSAGKTAFYFMQQWISRETIQLDPHSFGSLHVSFQLSSTN